MTYQEINTLIESIGVPSAYYQFTADTVVPPPFICFYFDVDNDLYADNVNYQKITSLLSSTRMKRILIWNLPWNLLSILPEFHTPATRHTSIPKNSIL